MALAVAAPCALAAPEAPPAAKKKKAPKTTKPKEPPPEAKPVEPAAAPATTPATAPVSTPPTPAGESGAAKPTTPPSSAVTQPAVAPAAASGETKVEEVTDFDAEEKQLDKRVEKAVGKPAGDKGSTGGPGFKFIVDLLAQYKVGQKSFSFFPDHSLVIMMVEISQRISLQLNIAPDPAFFELSFAVTPRINLKLGKMLLPFGTNNFHHIIGGRVDQSSKFLPETWADYGVGMSHLAYDGKSVSIEYELFAVNGFSGTTSPLVGVGTITDNNFAKGVGARVTTTLPHGVRLIGSGYHNLWDAENKHAVLFYSLGAVVPPGAIGLPVLDRVGLRGEWARGEIQLVDFNYQQGLLKHAVARAGWYAELSVRLLDELSLRVRAGRINPDNTVTDADDVELLEPALVIGSPKLSFVVAWQLTKQTGQRYSATAPSDVVYAKVFLQY